MISLKEIIKEKKENDKLIFFDYKNYVDEAIYFYTHLSIFDDSAVIYYNEISIKSYLQMMLNNILLEIKKFNPNIKEIKLIQDKQGFINKRNQKKFDEKIEKSKEKINNEDKEINLDHIPKDIKYYDHVINLAKIYEKTKDEYNEEKCDMCNTPFINLVYGKCPTCIEKIMERKLIDATNLIMKNPYYFSNSEIFLRARNLIYNKKIIKILEYISNTNNKINKNKYEQMLFEAIVYKTGSKDNVLIKQNIEILKRKIEKSYVRK